MSGNKSNRKYQKRENSRAIQRMHYWVREGAEELIGIKCKPTKLPKDEKFRDHYHIYCCLELGLGKVALRKIPCKCIACNNQMKEKWIHKKPAEEQTLLQCAMDCKYYKVLVDSKNGRLLSWNKEIPMIPITFHTRQRKQTY